MLSLALSLPSLAVLGGGRSPTLSIMGNRNALATATRTAQYFASAIIRKNGPRHIKRVRAVLPWWYVNLSEEEVGLGSGCTWWCWVEYPVGGTAVALAHGGSTTLTAADLSNAVAEADIDIPAGAYYRVHLKIDRGASGIMPQNTHAAAITSDRYALTTNAQNYTPGSTTSAGTSAGVNAVTPILLGYSMDTTPALIGVGDSILHAINLRSDWSTGADADGNMGYWDKLVCQSGYDCLNFGRSGSQASVLYNSGNPAKMAKRLEIMAMCGLRPIVVNELGHNDLGASISALQGYTEGLNSFWASIARETVMTTLTPWTAGPFDPVTQADLSSGKIATYNALVRGGSIAGASASKYIDLNAATRLGSNELLWNTSGGNYTGDGIHPNAYGDNQAAATLRTLTSDMATIAA